MVSVRVRKISNLLYQYLANLLYSDSRPPKRFCIHKFSQWIKTSKWIKNLQFDATHLLFFNNAGPFYPIAFKGCASIVFTHGVWMGGWAIR